MKERRIFMGALSLGLLLALAMGLGLWPRARAATQVGASPQDALGTTASAPLSTSFTYQGRLEANALPVNDTCNLRFILYNAEVGGTQIGPLQEQTGVTVRGGLFTVKLDFGDAAFDGNDRWLEIGVQCAGDSGLTIFTRQALTATPYALYATGAAWDGLVDVPEDLVDGDSDTLAALTCADGQIAEWDGSEWVCGDDEGTGDDGGDITAVNAGVGLSGGGESGSVTLDADIDYLQRRVNGTCAAGSSISVINSDGSVSCALDDDTLAALSCANGQIAEWDGNMWVCGDVDSGGESGDITAVNAGTGLVGGGASGNVTLDADTDYLQRRVDGSCAAGSSISAIHADGAVSCETDDDSGGDITAVNAGIGLNGGGGSGGVTLDVSFDGTGSGATVARSDHNHDSAYVNDDAGEIGDADVPAEALSADRISGTAWTSANDGSGSDMNADLLDGQHASAFAGSSHSHDSTYVNNDAGEVGDADVLAGTLSADRISGTAWTSTNDGSDSGMDADKLDGYHASSIMSAAGSTTIYGSTASDSVVQMDSFTVSAPGPGAITVMVIGSAWLDCDTSSSSSRLCTSAYLGICDTSGSSSTCGSSYDNYVFEDPDNVTQANEEHWITLARTVTVGAAGDKTFYLNGRSNTSGMDWRIDGYALAIFTPASMTVTNP